MMDMQKTIWIVNYYTAPPAQVSNPRHYEFAKYLVSNGYDVRVFFADREWEADSLQVIPDGKSFENKIYEGLKYTHIRTIPYKGNGVKRGLSILKFALDILRLRNEFEKPDVILLNMHAPFDYPIVWCAKFLKAKLITEAWDLWPDGFVRFGLMKANSPIVKFFYYVEKLMYQNADAIVFTFEGGIDYLKSRKWTTDKGGKIDSSKVFYINNGVNLELFEEYRRKYPVRDKDLLRDDIVKVLYLGSVRLVNNVKTLIDAAEILKDKDKVKFIIIGDGQDRPFLEEYCRKKQLSNVLFKEKHIPFCEVADVVSHASINIMNYQNNFGLYGVSSGKMFQYFAAGQPICCNIKLNYCEITKNNIGIAEDLNTPQEYANAIIKLVNLSEEEKIEMKKRIQCVARKYDYSYLSSQLKKIIDNI